MSDSQQILQSLSALYSKLESLEKKVTTVKQEWYDIKEAAAYLKITVRTLRDKIEKNLITYSQPEGKIYFKKSHLDNYLQSHLHKSKDELEIEASSFIGRKRRVI